MAELPPPATMKGPVWAARSRSGRTADRTGSASQEFFSEELDGHRELFDAACVRLPRHAHASIPLL